MVQRVGARLAAASGENIAWEFRLVRDDDVASAFCLPGGKVAVTTGILPYTRNEDGMAAVMGHVVAHALAHHGAERISQAMLTQEALARGALRPAEAAMGEGEAGVRAPILSALGLGAEVGFPLPYSRLHEHEADGIGLRLMVRAGYNPHEAARLWERMADANGAPGPALLSTHPEPRERASRLAGLIPRVLAEERGGTHAAPPPCSPPK
jgi:predicted Zn-dependent protease